MAELVEIEIFDGVVVWAGPFQVDGFDALVVFNAGDGGSVHGGVVVVFWSGHFMAVLLGPLDFIAAGFPFEFFFQKFAAIAREALLVGALITVDEVLVI